MIYTRINYAVQFQDVLHGFCAGRWTGTAIMELKLEQKLKCVDQDTLLLVLLDLRKAHENIDQGILLQTRAGYGAGPKLRGLLAEFWSRQDVVTHQNGFHASQFRATRGMTQGGLASPKLLIVEGDSMVCHWISLTVEEESTTHDGLGMVVERQMGMFYTDGGMIGSRDLEWIQGAINVLIKLFRRFYLMPNTEKYKTTTCQTGEIFTGM